VGTVTGRIGYAAGPAGRTLIYGKGGFGWTNGQIDMALNNALAGLFGPAITSNSTTVTSWGWTLGFGAEHALTPAWSLKVEYDYLAFNSQNANLGSSTFSPLFVPFGPIFVPLPLAAVPPGTSGISQNIQTVKVGVNYKWGTGGWESWDAVPPNYPVKAPPMLQAWLPGWEVEGGARYFGSWGQFHKDIGNSVNSGVPSISSISRLTYDDMLTNAGEFFGRVDTPWNLFMKGYIGGGSTWSGHMNDEDFGVPLPVLVPPGPGIIYAPYSNTVSGIVTGNISYGVIDGGYDLLRGPGYKVGAFVGYFYLNQQINAFGCTPIANLNCIPTIPASGNPGITENKTWRAVRVGVSGETMLSDRVKLSGEVAYLPYVNIIGPNQHFFGNSGVLAEVFPEFGTGVGVQLEALVSYYLTREFSVGVGGRYWGMWTTIPPTPPSFFRGVTEQAGAFVQASYTFGPEWF